MGTIGVRCAHEQRVLWFHVDHHLWHSSVSFKRLYAQGPYDVPSPAWEEFTPSGQHVLAEVRNVEGVVSIDVRQKEVGVFVRDPQHWREVLPRVVEAIRRATNDPGAQVRWQPSINASVPQWHRGLMEELFG